MRQKWGKLIQGNSLFCHESNMGAVLGAPTTRFAGSYVLLTWMYRFVKSISDFVIFKVIFKFLNFIQPADIGDIIHPGIQAIRAFFYR